MWDDRLLQIERLNTEVFFFGGGMFKHLHVVYYVEGYAFPRKKGICSRFDNQKVLKDTLQNDRKGENWNFGGYFKIAATMRVTFRAWQS